MGKRGPAPQPSILKYVRGNPGKETLNTNEPTPDLVSDDLAPPEVLDKVGQEIWEDSVMRLSHMKVLTVADIPVLTRYCIEKVLYLKCYEKVKTMGEEYTHFEPDPTRADGKLRIKYTQVAPWATQMHRHHQAMLQIEREFGMTPSSRSQLTVGKGESDANSLAAFTKKKSG